jgi:hypothetical protein
MQKLCQWSYFDVRETGNLVNVLLCICGTKIESRNVVFEVLTTVVMKSSVFLDMTPCSPLKVNWRSEGTYHLHLQGQRISQARNQHESRWKAEDGRWHVPQKCQLTLNGLHAIMSQKIELFRIAQDCGIQENCIYSRCYWLLCCVRHFTREVQNWWPVCTVVFIIDIGYIA